MNSTQGGKAEGFIYELRLGNAKKQIPFCFSAFPSRSSQFFSGIHLDYESKKAKKREMFFCIS